MLYKYHIKVYYTTPIMDKITGYMQQILPEWKQSKKCLEACRMFEIVTGRPLSDDEIARIKACKEDWMDEIIVERVTQ